MRNKNTMLALGERGEIHWSPAVRSTLILSVVVLTSFLVLSRFGLEEEFTMVVERGWNPVVFALIAVALLAADVVLPVPGTLVMLVAGLSLGSIVGTAVNVAGLMASAAIGYGLGHVAAANDRTSRWLGFDAARHGALSPASAWWVAATRGLPILNEAVAISAGGLAMPPRSYALGSIIGALPIALVYAVAGDRLHGGDYVGLIVATVILFLHGLVVLARVPRSPLKSNARS